MSAILLKVFLALGGVALIWKLVGSNARKTAHNLAGFLILKIPGAKPFIAANAEKILKIIDEFEDGLQDAVHDVETEAKPKALDSDKKVQ